MLWKWYGISGLKIRVWQRYNYNKGQHKSKHTTWHYLTIFHSVIWHYTNVHINGYAVHLPSTSTHVVPTLNSEFMFLSFNILIGHMIYIPNYNTLLDVLRPSLPTSTYEIHMHYNTIQLTLLIGVHEIYALTVKTPRRT